MKFCKYCHTVMESEYMTHPSNSHRYKGFHTCPQCGALCDDDVTERGQNKTVHSEMWIPPERKEGEGR